MSKKKVHFSGLDFANKSACGGRGGELTCYLDQITCNQCLQRISDVIAERMQPMRYGLPARPLTKFLEPGKGGCDFCKDGIVLCMRDQSLRLRLDQIYCMRCGQHYAVSDDDIIKFFGYDPAEHIELMNRYAEWEKKHGSFLRDTHTTQ